MALLAARLTRSIPLLIVLAVLAVVIYLVVSYIRSPLRAKELLIKIFTWICLIITVFFCLVALYAVFDGHQAVVELSLSFAAVGLVGLIITRICNYVFRKHHPHYREKATKARIIHHWPWEKRG